MTGRGDAAIASSQARKFRRAHDATAELDHDRPHLLGDRHGASAGAKQLACHDQAPALARTISTPTAPGLLVELLDHDPRRLRARMGEAELGDLLRQGLDKVDVAARDDRFDAFDDGVVIERLADVVIERVGRDEIDIDREAHALRHALLVRVDADLDVEHEIVHEHPVRDVGFMGTLFGADCCSRCSAILGAPSRRESAPRHS
jgi:hypothetical protein